MAAPTITARLDKTRYQPGETMTLTVEYGDPDHRVARQTITVQDSAGTDTVVTTEAVVDPLTVTVEDPDRQWARTSDNGTVAVYTATA